MMYGETDIEKVVDVVRRHLESIKEDNPDVSFNVVDTGFDEIDIQYEM